jgi:hypothetical protein
LGKPFFLHGATKDLSQRLILLRVGERPIEAAEWERKRERERSPLTRYTAGLPNESLCRNNSIKMR